MGYASPDEEWRALLTGDHANMLRLRRQFRHLPAAPRCKLCHAPFNGVGGFLLRPWFGPWERNAQLCKSCMKHLPAGVGVAEVGCRCSSPISGDPPARRAIRRPSSRPSRCSIAWPPTRSPARRDRRQVRRRRGDRAVHPRLHRARSRGQGDRRRAGPPGRGRSQRRVVKWADPGRSRDPHRDRLRRQPRLERTDLRLHRPRRSGEHDRPAGVARPGGRAPHLGRGRRTGLARRDRSRAPDGRGPRRTRRSTFADHPVAA